MPARDEQQRRRRITGSGLLKAAAAVTALLSLLTALGIAGHLLELFVHFRLQFLCISVLLMIALAILKEWRYSGVLLLAALVNFAFIYPWYAPAAQASAGPRTLTLLHANVYSGNDDYAGLLELVRDEAPDMVFLQEVTQQWIDGSRALLPDYPYSYLEPRAGNFGIALYSRIPLQSVRHVDSPPFGYPSIVAQIAVGDATLTLISTHPTIPLGSSLYKARNEQLGFIAKLVAAIDGRKVLLGDLNASVWDAQLERLQSDSGLVNARLGFGILPTWPTFLPFAMIPIDHVLVSDGVGVIDIHTARSIGSDHLPLVVTISL